MVKSEDPVETGRQPLAFRVAGDVLRDQWIRPSDGMIGLRTRARTLGGMQKEAIVEYGPTGAAWRLLCDEGPWLNGTDLAPFPLGFFAGGVAASFMSAILSEAADRAFQCDALALRMDNFFTMEGSALQGTMTAGVDGIHVAVDAGRGADDGQTRSVVTDALADRSAVNRALGGRLPSRFSVRVNGDAVAWPGEGADHLKGVADPGPVFDRLRPGRQNDGAEAIVRKDDSAPGPASGDAVGLQPDQKRSVHLHSEARLRPDGLKEIAVQCVQPAGSRFVLLSDDAVDSGGEGRAPCGLTYLSAGVAFCFMTQLGRYAKIRKLQLDGYRIVQETSFRRCGSDNPAALPVETLVCLDSRDSVESNLRMVQMGEQTCYLHTTFREAVDVSLTIVGH